MARDQAEARLAHAGSDAPQERQLPNRYVHRSFVDELLDLMQLRFASFDVELDGLFLKELVNIGIAAVHISAALCDEGFKARRGIAESSARALDDILKSLFRVSLEESRPLKRPEFGADAHSVKIVDHGLSHVGIRTVTVVVTGVEAPGITRLSQ